ncbi:response regulator [Cellvibrio japonicus]|uniref:histidine kinase n=1 Tax=Cellvibrio japonicus (strain Ueda107) TaxID=498211 RepID=B3PI20_CELJU|nr:response regulator [Cellvibrio japonicus]ACE83837.1 MmoS [Cellvibrio japonicus Ueda107]
MLNLKRYMRENPIVARLLGLIIISSSVITLFAILLQLHSNFNDDIAELEKRLDQVRISTLASITKSLWGFDQEQLNIQIHSVLDVDDVVQVSVTWHDWNNIKQHLVATNPHYSLKDLETKPSQFLVRDYPLIYEDSSTPPQELGVLTVTASLAGIYEKLWERAFFVALVQGTKTLIIALFIIWLVHTLLTRHIKIIANYTRNLNLESLTKPLKLQRMKMDSMPDELDNVVNAINHMRETLLDDIEQRHAIELALLSEKEEKLETRRQKNAAEDASRAKSQFLATMSHEIRTPMNGVIGMLDMLRDTPLDENQKHYIDVIHRSGETLLSIINDILDYSKIEAGKMQLEEMVFELDDLVENCIQLFGATANKRNIELFGGLNPDVPRRLRGDPTRLRQIIINLLGNAFKFTEEGFVSLEVGLDNTALQAEGRLMLRFVVQDSGIGIDPNSASNLFDSFNQADASTTRKYGGTGLGLAICKSLAELMGGRIGVKSAKGEGAQFWFTAQFDVQELASPSLTPDPTLKGKRLLMVETSAPLVTFTQRYCDHWGLLLETAFSAKQAVALLKHGLHAGEPFDFVAFDYSLPDATGFELAQWLRDAPDFTELPVFMFSGGDVYHDQAVMQRLAIHTVLRKPISVKALYRELIALLGHEAAPTVLPAEKVLARDKFAHLQVLVAEDNPVNRMVIKGLLGKLGIQPVFAENGREAVDLVHHGAQRFDLILMDCEMPEMDGFEATRNIRELERRSGRPAVPVVALTAHALQEHREAVFASGMNYYLAKPITFDSLYAAFDALGVVVNPENSASL